MKKRITIFLSVLFLVMLVGCSKANESNNIPGGDSVVTQKTYEVEIDGEVYYADSQEEIDEIINEHIYGDIDSVFDSADSNGYIDTDETGKPMIEVESGKYLGVSSGGYTEFYFKVRNVSDVAVHTISINIDILDEYGDIIDTTHPQEPSTLQPGQALIIDALTKNDRGGVSAIVSSYSLYTIDGEYARGRITESAKVEFDDVVIEETDGSSQSNKISQSTTSKDESEQCIECGKSASYTYTNPFSGKEENYCYSHYKEIIDIMSMMEEDVGNSNQSTRTCVQCSREGIHKYDSFTGQTEYYCTQHYEELMDMLEAFGLS